jgi:hypothetical protein
MKWTKKKKKKKKYKYGKSSTKSWAPLIEEFRMPSNQIETTNTLTAYSISI